MMFIGLEILYSILKEQAGVKKLGFLGVRTCEVFLCFVAIIFALSIVLISLFYVTRERNRFLHRR